MDVVVLHSYFDKNVAPDPDLEPIRLCELQAPNQY